ncbi:MAG TPA: alkaline phosphatase family protein [Rhizomicrobium sp.]|nr:alkaline phosphatase family protein [Rhizomicrobium sp.]
MIRRLAAVASFVTAAATLGAAPALAAPAPAATPPIRHVFVIVLENENYDATFGAGTEAPYLGTVLPAKGALVANYYATGHASLGNYIALISGQPEAPMINADCPKFVDLAGAAGAPATVDAAGIATGNGCVYPPAIQTVADQLEAAHLTWRGYMEDMGNDPLRPDPATPGVPVPEPRSCARPAPGGNGVLHATPTDSYAYRHNPFIYFHSIVDRPGACDANDVRLEQLTSDLRRVATTPNFSFIVPSVCNDGHDKPACANGSPGGLVAADAWLKLWVPRILAAPAFKKDGLLVITFDEAAADGTACCNEPSGPNVTAQGVYGPGGGRTGAVLLSPFVKPGTVLAEPVNHYGLLKSVEDIFALPHLGLAADPGLATFASAYARP